MYIDTVVVVVVVVEARLAVRLVLIVLELGVLVEVVLLGTSVLPRLSQALSACNTSNTGKRMSKVLLGGRRCKRVPPSTYEHHRPVLREAIEDPQPERRAHDHGAAAMPLVDVRWSEATPKLQVLGRELLAVIVTVTAHGSYYR